MINFKMENPSGFPHKVVKEKRGDIEFTDIYIRYGANVYIFTYPKDGERRHTLIDTGYTFQKDNLLEIFKENEIDPEKIENIILTHRHSDHCGLAHDFSGMSGARIITHSAFRAFVENPVSSEEKIWLRGFVPSLLRDCPMDYRDPIDTAETVDIAGLAWPVLGEPIPLGTSGRLEILGCPEGFPTHSPDQVVVRYSPGDGNENRIVKPTENIIFSGDLWLMHGPVTEKSLRHVSTGLAMGFQMIKNIRSGGLKGRNDPRLQDIPAKESLKYGFVAVRVKPGHGREFLGTRLIPKTLLADRDLLVKLGYAMDDDHRLLQSPHTRVKKEIALKQAYDEFISEMEIWSGFGYSGREAGELLARIYLEQQGGGNLVALDRSQRRARLKEILFRIGEDGNAGAFLLDTAHEALEVIEKI